MNQEKRFAAGMRNQSRLPLDEEQILRVKNVIRFIQADESVFVFNDPDHIDSGTSYNYVVDKIFVSQNVFPDLKYPSSHPRDMLSVAAVLAHEYYGHRVYRDEYLQDYKEGTKTTPLWLDECRASLTAARVAPGLAQRDRAFLVNDAIVRAQEYGHVLELNEDLKEILYGEFKYQPGIIRPDEGLTRTRYESDERDQGTRDSRDALSEMSHDSETYDDFER